MLHRVKCVWKPAIAVAAIASLSACTPANTTSTGFLSYEPNAGYDWVDPDGWSWAVAWKPGKAHPSHPKVFAAQTPNNWVPAFGYDWVSPDTRSLAVAWKAGLTYPSLPHVATHSKEGHWVADPGYAFKGPETLEVVWRPGTLHPVKAHFVAAAQEGHWDVDAGYRKVPGILGGEWAQWTPGTAHPRFANVYAAQQEGYWLPAAGYTFASANSLDVVPLPAPEYASAGSSYASSAPSPAGRFFGGLLKAVVAQQFAESQPGDGLFATLVGRPAARALRDDGIDDMAGAISGN